MHSSWPKKFGGGELFLFCYIADRQNCVSGSTARRVQPRIESQQNYGWLFKQPNKSAFSSACAVFGLLLFRCASTIVPRVLLSEICPCLAVASFDITCRSPFIKVLKRGKSQQMFVYNSRRCIIIIETNVIHSFVQTLNTFDCLFFTTFEFSWSKRFWGMCYHLAAGIERIYLRKD